MDDKIFTQVLGFFNESSNLNKIKELENISLPTAAVKEDTDMFNSEFREGFGFLSLSIAIQ